MVQYFFQNIRICFIFPQIVFHKKEIHKINKNRDKNRCTYLTALFSPSEGINFFNLECSVLSLSCSFSLTRSTIFMEFHMKVMNSGQTVHVLKYLSF